MKHLQALALVSLLLQGCSSDEPNKYSELLSETTSPLGFHASAVIQSNWDGFRRTYVFIHSPDEVCGYTAVYTDAEVRDISLQWIDGFNVEIVVPQSPTFEKLGDNEGFPCPDMEKTAFSVKTHDGDA